MNDEDLRQVLKVIEDRVVATQGEAVLAGLMLSALLPTLISKGVMAAEEMEQMMDTALLVLEHQRGPLDDGAQRVVDYARSRLEAQMALLKRPQAS